MRFLPETGSRLEQKTRKQSSDWFPDWNKMLRETTLTQNQESVEKCSKVQYNLYHKLSSNFSEQNAACRRRKGVVC